jgi:hypothetical protein
MEPDAVICATGATIKKAGSKGLSLVESASEQPCKLSLPAPAKIDFFSFFNQRAVEWAFCGAGKFAWAHAENFVGCRPAILFASAIWSYESEPK